ncbi:MAG: zf-HC2 domain-containing protein, partial [Deltaproteobacteria bacterium]|nr:zf-HC2 domain-containing protein [Deltaproteobacteria bacterium]
MPNPIASEQLSAYLDGELTDTERAELEQQIAGDPVLREELQELEQAVDFLRTHGPVQAPLAFQSGVLQAVKHEPMPGTWWRWIRRPFGLPVEGLAVALAAALVLLIALPFGTNTGRQAMRDLVGDPYGFVRSEEPSTAPAAP